MRELGVLFLIGAMKGPSLRHRVETGFGVHPASYSMGTEGSSLGMQQPGYFADHSPLSSAKIKNTRHYTSTPPIRFHGVLVS